MSTDKVSPTYEDNMTKKACTHLGAMEVLEEAIRKNHGRQLGEDGKVSWVM